MENIVIPSPFTLVETPEWSERRFHEDADYYSALVADAKAWTSRRLDVWALLATTRESAEESAS